MAQREQYNRKLYKTQDKTEILSVLVSKIGTLYRIYKQIRDEQNTERVTKGKRVNKAKPLDVLKKAHKNQPLHRKLSLRKAILWVVRQTA